MLPILMQEDNVTGLQIKQAAKWVPITPIPDTFLVKVGDNFEVNTANSMTVVVQWEVQEH